MKSLETILGMIMIFVFYKGLNFIWNKIRKIFKKGDN